MRTIAFYLPQFHEIPENNNWWGEGFTEWTNVRKAKKMFPFHYQPHVPAHDEYYNLLDDNVIERQMKLARKYGIDGFCFYHYWFAGHKLLEKPIERVLNNAGAFLPFCLAWANEPWTRTWHGAKGDKEVLIGQKYGGETEWKEHFNYLLPFFKDKRYIKEEGKPIFLIYKAGYMGNAGRMFEVWNEMAKMNGFEGMYFIKMQTGSDRDLKNKFLQKTVDFEPGRAKRERSGGRLWFIEKREQFLNLLREDFLFNGFLCEYMSYDSINRAMLDRTHKKGEYRGIFVNYDDTPRRGRKGLIIVGSTPKKFSRYLVEGLQKSIEEGNDLFFINAWNEWGEGNHLEPDKRYGYAYLHAVRKAVHQIKICDVGSQ